MTEPDKTITNPIVRLMAYGVTETRIKLCQEILPEVSTPEELEKELSRRKTSFDGAQLLMHTFRSIYQNEPPIRKQAQQALSGIGVPPDIVDKYFTELSDQPYLAFHFMYEDRFPLEVRERFNDSAAQIILNTVKSYLGLMQQEPQPKSI